MAARISITRSLRAAALSSSNIARQCIFRPVVATQSSRSFSIAGALWQRKFTKDHEWVELSSDKKTCTVGITDYAAKAIGDVTWVELPESDVSFAAEDVLATIESVKAANEIYAPLSGSVIEVNQALDEDPKLVNQSPESDAWIVKMSVDKPEEFESLLDESAYKNIVQQAEKDG